jgi:hypothetical protein
VSLQFHPATGYFSMIRGMIPGRAFWWSALMLCVACGERDRLVFPTDGPSGDGEGPITEISQPGVPDTSVSDGDIIFVHGRTYDPDGVDTVYLEVGGANQGFLPLVPEGLDTVPFTLQISTLGLAGADVLVRIHGVDKLGDQGFPVNRQIRVQ